MAMGIAIPIAINGDGRGHGRGYVQVLESRRPADPQDPEAAPEKKT